VQALIGDEEVHIIIKIQRSKNKAAHGIDNIPKIHEFSHANNPIRPNP
jgi:hypothetical protein